MKLRYSTTSPYVRKVRILLIETGLDREVELILTNPWSPDTDLANDNPLSKVPALVTDDGRHFFDSPVICEYLDSLHGGRKHFPRDGEARWAALRRLALADGMLDAAVSLRIELAMRPEALRWPWWIERQKAVLARGLDLLEADAATLSDLADIGEIGVVCLLGYLDFRLPQDAWRPTHPRLAGWYAAVAQRPSVVATAPHD